MTSSRSSDVKKPVEKSWNSAEQVNRRVIFMLDELNAYREGLWYAYKTRKDINSWHAARCDKIPFCTKIRNLIANTKFFIKDVEDEKKAENLLKLLESDRVPIVERDVVKFWKQVYMLIRVFDVYQGILHKLNLWNLRYFQEFDENDFMA